MKHTTARTSFLIFILALLTQASFAQRGEIQYFRPYDQRGVNMYETSKNDYTGFTDPPIAVMV